MGVAGLVVNKDDGTGEAAAFAEAVGIPVLSAIPQHEDIRRKSANYEIVGRPGGQWAPMFEELAMQVATAPPLRPTPLSHDQLLDLFKGDAVGRDVVAYARHPGGHAGRGVRGAQDPRSGLRRGLMP